MEVIDKTKTKKMKQTIETKLGVIIILIVAVTVGVFVWKWEKNQPEIQQPQIMYNMKKATATQTPAANQNVDENSVEYVNKAYDYEMKIPAKFDLKSGSVNDPDSSINIFSKKENTLLFSINIRTSQFNNINAWFGNYEQKLSGMTSYEGVKVSPPTVLSSEKAYVDGIEAKKIILSKMPFSNYLIVFIKNNLIYTISYNGLLEKEKETYLQNNSKEHDSLLDKLQSEYRLELDNMVETFKFNDHPTH